MDSRSRRPLPESLTELPVEAPVDDLIPSAPPTGKRPQPASSPALAPPEKGVGGELGDAEKLLLASEQTAPEPERAPPKAAAAAALIPPAPEPARAAASAPAAAVRSAPEPPRTAPPTQAPPTQAPRAPTAPAPTATAAPLATAAPPAELPAGTASAGPALMDRDFIARNQVVERYLSGRLPIKGATDFERFCREHPELLDELGIPERVNAALRLLEASGKPEPWSEPPKPFWQKLEILLGLLAAVVVLGIALAVVASGSAQKTRRIAALQQEAMERPLDPATSTRDIRLLPSRDGASNAPAIVIGGGSEAQLAELRIDESRSPYRLFRITIDRIDQGRVAVIDHLAKDSDGNLRISLNSTALGPGDYQLTIEGLNWQGQPQPDSWVTIGIQASQ
jgi:hypothetical protein